MFTQTISKNIIYLAVAIVVFFCVSGITFAQEESYEVAGGDDGSGNVSAAENENVTQSYTVDGNHVSFDASVPAGSVVIDTPNYNASFNSWGDPSSGVSVTGPEGTTAQVTQNPDGSFHVSFSSPSNTDVQFSDISFVPDDNQNFDVTQGGSISFNPVEDFPDWKCDGCTAPVLTAAAACDGTQPVVNLAWNPIPGIPYGSHEIGSIYQIFRDPAFNLLPYYNSNGTIAKWNNGWESNPGFYQDRAVSPNTIYFYRVFGSDGDINIGYSPEVEGFVTTVNYSKRTPVSNVMAVHTLSCDGSDVPGQFTLSNPSASCPTSSPQVALTWSESSRAVSYTIFMRNLSNGIETPVAVRGSDERNFILDGSRGIEPGQRYGFLIAARNSSGDVTYSNNGVWTDVGFGGTEVTCNTPPPGAFTLNPPETFCGGTNSYIRLSWTAAPNGPSASTNSGYFVYVDGVYQYNALHATNLSDPAARNIGQTYRYRVEAVTPSGRTFSNEQTVTARECRSPSINLTVTTPRGTFPYGGLPVSVRQGESATINWDVQFADWIGTTANPARADWTGSRGSNGSQPISTLTSGNYVLGLSAGNTVNTTAVSIQLNVLRPPAFIQTTGGDVHTNEDIFISPN